MRPVPQARLRARTLAMPTASSKTAYFTVPLKDLPTATVLGFDVFIRHIDGEAILYRSSELPFTEENRNRLVEGGIREILVKDSQRASLESHLARGETEDAAGEPALMPLLSEDELRLEMMIADPHRPVEERCKVLLSVTGEVVEEALSDLGSAGLPERLYRVAETTARFLLAEPAAYSRMVEMFRLDFVTYNHSAHTALYTLELARARGLADPRELARIGRAALLHDVGKGEIPASILHKDCALNDLEWAEVMTHPDRGVALLQQHGWDDEVVLQVCGMHHERWDGAGYTRGLAGEQIPVPVRMVSIADTFDALTSSYPHRPALSGFQALWRMKHEMVGQLDPDLFQVFVDVMTRRTGRR